MREVPYRTETRLVLTDFLEDYKPEQHPTFVFTWPQPEGVSAIDFYEDLEKQWTGHIEGAVESLLAYPGNGLDRIRDVTGVALQELVTNLRHAFNDESRGCRIYLEMGRGNRYLKGSVQAQGSNLNPLNPEDLEAKEDKRHSGEERRFGNFGSDLCRILLDRWQVPLDGTNRHEFLVDLKLKFNRDVRYEILGFEQPKLLGFKQKSA